MKYCSIWWQRIKYQSLSTIVIASFIVICNQLISNMFYKLIKMQKRKRKVDESTSISRTIVFHQILNNGFVFYIISCLRMFFEKVSPSIYETYYSHSENFFIDNWYSKYSALIFYILFIQIFPFNIIVLAQNTLLSLSRYCCDRRCKCSRKKT